jgi:predicted RNA-binding protein
MCLAKAYLKGDGEGELLLEDVVLVEIDGEKLRLSTLFGEERELDGTIEAVDFQNASLIVQASNRRPVPPR